MKISFFSKACIIALLIMCFSACVQPKQPPFGDNYKRSVEDVQQEYRTSALTYVPRRAISQEEIIKLTQANDQVEIDASLQAAIASGAAATAEEARQIILQQVAVDSAQAEETSPAQKKLAAAIAAAEEEIEKVDPSQQLTIALLLPFSGDEAAVAKSMYQSIEMALFEEPKIKAKINLLSFDTKNSPEEGTKSFLEAIRKNASLVIGPMNVEVAKAVAQENLKHQLPVIALTFSAELLKKPILQLGTNPALEVKRVVNYAYETGLRKFSMLLPEKDTSKLILDEVRDALRLKNLRLQSTERYEGADEQLSRSIENVTFLDPSLPPQPENSQGLITPEGDKMLLTILARLNRRDIKSTHMRLLGSSEWDQSYLMNEPRLSGGWFAMNPPNKINEFKRNFTELYGYEPKNEIIVAYDAIKIATELLKTPNPDPFRLESLTRPQGFVGATGLFRFLPNGTAERTLAVVEISKGRLEILEQAPAVFRQITNNDE